MCAFFSRKFECLTARCKAIEKEEEAEGVSVAQAKVDAVKATAGADVAVKAAPLAAAVAAPPAAAPATSAAAASPVGATTSTGLGALGTPPAGVPLHPGAPDSKLWPPIPVAPAPTLGDSGISGPNPHIAALRTPAHLAFWAKQRVAGLANSRAIQLKLGGAPLVNAATPWKGSYCAAKGDFYCPTYRDKTTSARVPGWNSGVLQVVCVLFSFGYTSTLSLNTS